MRLVRVDHCRRAQRVVDSDSERKRVGFDGAEHAAQLRRVVGQRRRLRRARTAATAGTGGGGARHGARRLWPPGQLRVDAKELKA